MECVKEINFHIFHDDIQSYLHVLVVDSGKPLCKRYSKGHGQPLAHTVLRFLNACESAAAVLGAVPVKTPSILIAQSICLLLSPSVLLKQWFLRLCNEIDM